MILIFFVFGLSCNHKDTGETTLMIALINDIDSFNPITSTDVFTASIQKLLFPALTNKKWIDSIGGIEYEPLVADRWDISVDKKHITFYIKQNKYWEDNNKISINDIIYTYNIYANPISAAPSGYLFESIQQNGFKKINDSIFSVTYNEYSNDPLAFSSLRFVQNNYFSSDIKALREDKRGYKPITCGPYRIEKWETNNQIILTRNEEYNLSSKPKMEKIIFKVLPDYVSRLTALKANEIDFMVGIRPEDAEGLKSEPNIGLINLSMSNYEFICWNNIDGQHYNSTGEIRPHRLFGNKNVRRALTMAIDRDEIIQACLGAYGEPCKSPISPIFKNEYNSDLKAIPYDPLYASTILANEEGWLDHNQNGIIDKDGVEFSFTLAINSGNPRREYVANMIKTYLQKIGIEVKIEKLEWNIFDMKTMNRELDAFITGLSVSIDLDLYSLWYSDFSKAQMNDVGFQNERVDFLIDNINVSDKIEAITLYKEFQEILHEEQPCTFLYWYSNIIGYNQRLKGVNPNILDFYNDICNWSN